DQRAGGRGALGADDGARGRRRVAGRTTVVAGLPDRLRDGISRDRTRHRPVAGGTDRRGQAAAGTHRLSTRSRILASMDFLVADLSLADYGRKEISLAEHEMPGLMAMRAEYGPTPPLRGARVTGSLH